MMREKVGSMAGPYIESFKKLFSYNIKVVTDKKAKTDKFVLKCDKAFVEKVLTWYNENMQIVCHQNMLQYTSLPLVYPTKKEECVQFEKQYVLIFRLAYQAYKSLSKQYGHKMPSKWESVSEGLTTVAEGYKY
jgi:hypothetical protein